jgi:fatty acid-binding protein DegV
LDQLIEIAKEKGAAGAKPLAVMHGDAPDVDKFVDDLCAALGRSRDGILIGDIGSVVGTHAGPRVIGIAYDQASA